MRSRIIIKRWIKFLVPAVLIVVAGILILNAVIRQKISRQLQSLSSAIKINYSSVHSNLLTASVSFNDLEIIFIPYENLPASRHTLHFSHASLNGINFFKLLFSKKLSVSSLRLEKGNIMIDKFLLDKKDSAQAKIFEQIKMPFKTIGIDHLELTTIRAYLNTDSLGPPLVTGDLAVHEIQISKPGTSTGKGQFRFAGIDCNLSDLNYSLPDSTAILHIRRLVMDSRKGDLHLDSLQIAQGGNRGNHTIEASVPFLQVTKADMMKLFQNKLVAEKIFIPQGEIKVNNPGKLFSDDTRIPVSFQIKNFQADHLSLIYNDGEQKLSCKAAIHVDEGKANISKDSFSYATIKCNLSELRYFNNSSHHTLAINKLELDSEREIIRINDLKLIPQYGKYEFDAKLGHQADRVEAAIPEIEIVKPDISRLFKNKLVAEKILIAESKAYIFRDRRLPISQKNIPLPVAYMKTFPVDIRVKTCTLAPSIVEYEEYPKEGFGKTGVLRIEGIRTTISPLINHPLDSDPDHITMHVNASIMGSGTAHGTIIMPLRSNQPYHITGAIENLELTKLNSSSENLGKIRIKSGLLDFLSFDFVMNDERSTGKIIGAYHDLVIQPLKKHTDKKNVADFASFMVRHLIIPLNKDKSLPEKKRTGDVNYARDPTRFVSNYFLQSLLMGVKKSFTLGFLLPK